MQQHGVVHMDTSFIKSIRPIFWWISPAVVMFLLALIPTIKYGNPLSWDVYYHVHMAHLYMVQGFTYWDPLTYAPYGRPIYYPPLFHFLLAAGNVFNQDILTVARGLQPVFAFLILLSFTYVTYRIYNACTAFFAGFLAMSTSMIHRFVLPIPESLAMIIFPLALYLYYRSVEDDSYRYAAVAGVLAGVISLTHALSFLILVMVVTVFTLALIIVRKHVYLKQFMAFLGATLIVASVWWLPLILKYGYVFLSPASQIVGLVGYLPIFGALSLILMPVGGYLILKRREIRDVLLLIWLLSLIFLANIYLLGVSMLSERILTFAVFPLAIIAGLGLDYIRTQFNIKWFYLLGMIIVGVAVISGGYYMSHTEPLVSTSEIDVAIWFQAHGDGEGVVVSQSYKLDPTIVAISGQPVATGGYDNGKVNQLDTGKYIDGNFTKLDVTTDKVGYIVLNVGMGAPPYSTLVYQNDQYKIYSVER